MTAEKYRRGYGEFWRAFAAQKQSLRSSALSFDGGATNEAVRMANSVFVLVGRGLRRHTSILDHIGIQDQVQFVTSVRDGSQSATPLFGALVIWGSGPPQVELRPLGFAALMTNRFLSFEEWWNEAVMKDGQGRQLTRGTIVRCMRDQDGGAHYDGALTDPVYVAAQRGELTGFTLEDENGNQEPVPYGLEATMRQIAEEMLLIADCIDQRFGIRGATMLFRASTGAVNLKPEKK